MLAIFYLVRHMPFGGACLTSGEESRERFLRPAERYVQICSVPGSAAIPGGEWTTKSASVHRSAFRFFDRDSGSILEMCTVGAVHAQLVQFSSLPLSKNES